VPIVGRIVTHQANLRRTHKNQKVSISEQLLAFDAHMITRVGKKRVP
jgi:hypothetical protein